MTNKGTPQGFVEFGQDKNPLHANFPDVELDMNIEHTLFRCQHQQYSCKMSKYAARKFLFPATCWTMLDM